MIFNRKNKDYNYFKIFLAVFLGISCSIVVYFIFSKFNYISSFLSKLINILAPVIIGVLFAYLVNPLVSRLERYFKKKDKIRDKNKLARAIAIIIIYLIFIISAVILIRFFIPSLLESINVMFQNIPKYLDNIFGFIKNVCEKYNISSKFIDSYRSSINELIKNSVVPNIDIIINNLAMGIRNVVKWIINIVVSIIISVYLVYDKEEFSEGMDKILQAYCSPKVYDEIVNISKYIYKVFGGFLVAKGIDSIIIGILTFIVLKICGIPYALLISVIVGITNIIPFFGPFIGAIPSGLLLLMISPTKALEFGIIILIIQQFDGNILSPKLIGNKLGIKSFWVLFAILLFGGLFGFPGMVIAVPLFACIYEFCRVRVVKRLKEKEEQEKALEEEQNKQKKRLRLRLKKES